jgi:hypothetical protein
MGITSLSRCWKASQMDRTDRKAEGSGGREVKREWLLEHSLWLRNSAVVVTGA